MVRTVRYNGCLFLHYTVKKKRKQEMEGFKTLLMLYPETGEIL